MRCRLPPNISEADATDLAVLPGVSVPVPRLADAPPRWCRHYTTLEVPSRRHLILGSVLRLHARPGIIDPEQLRVNLDVYKPVARLVVRGIHPDTRRPRSLLVRQLQLTVHEGEAFGSWAA